MSRRKGVLATSQSVSLESHRQKPSWCLLVITMYRMPAAFAIATQPDEGVRQLRNGAVDQWLRRSLGDSTLGAQLDELVRARLADMPAEDGTADSVLAARAVAMLDPLAPVSWRGLSLFPDGLGAALAGAAGTEAERTLAEMVTKMEADHHATKFELFSTMFDYKHRWDEEIERCRRLGLPEPQPVPHPDDVILDPNTGDVKILGPSTKEQKQRLDHALVRRAEAQELVNEFASRYHRTRDASRKARWLEEWH